MIQIDKQATAARRFEHEKSRVLKDGREILFGLDWAERKKQLWYRCNGRCEYMDPNWQTAFGHVFWKGRCTAEAVDPHHLVRRSELRDDRLANLQALCRFHHDLLDPRKVRSDKRARREREAVKCD